MNRDTLAVVIKACLPGHVTVQCSSVSLLPLAQGDTETVRITQEVFMGQILKRGEGGTPAHIPLARTHHVILLSCKGGWEMWFQLCVQVGKKVQLGDFI